MIRKHFVTDLLLLATISLVPAVVAAEINVIFIGDNGPHRPEERFRIIQPVLAQRGIDLVYTDQVTDLNPDSLANYQAVMLYANIDRIAPREEKALLEFVESGGGFVPIHCASFCFRNSEAVVALIGAQFLRHGTGVFRTEIVEPRHPVMEGFAGIESWDETYVHHRHNEKDRTVLSYRVDEGNREPWTWVRTQGKGRVFYTAWGHDHRTWGNAGFQNLLERGLRWSVGESPEAAPVYAADRPFPIPEMSSLQADAKPFEYIDVGAKIPNYTPGSRWGTQGEPLNVMQKPLDAKESMKHMIVPKGFRVELFAAEPNIGGKPICMAWDERGRLWVAETYDYPNELQPSAAGRDRIRICEDTDGDWVADNFTVFAEQLSIPTSITFHNGGAVVQNGVETLFLKDIDGDDRADVRETIFTGWALGDTHGGVSNFQYGLDNWIWAMQGYNSSRPHGRSGRFQGFRMGFFRFRPDGSEIEFLRSTDNNTWGLGITEEGLIFGSTANRNPSVYMPIPNRYYEAVRGWTPSLTLEPIAENHLFQPITDKVRQVDHHGGYTAGAGHAVYTARRYPREYWNRVAFVNGPTGHLVGTYLLNREGAGFNSRYHFNLLASDDEWTAPIMAEVGPDGNVWVIDWYNYIVQHNPTPRGFETGKGNAYETDLRDKKHGRIYRVVYDETGSAAPFSLSGASPETLASTLRHSNMFWRKHAQRLLVERGKLDVLPALIELVQDRHTDEIGLNVGAIHALWTMHGLGALHGSNPEATSAAQGALEHPSAGVRRNAAHVLPPAADSTAALLAAGLHRDSDHQVRLAALLALAERPPSRQAGKLLAELLSDPVTIHDRWLMDALTAAAANNSNSFLAELKSLSRVNEGIVDLVSVVAEHYARGAKFDQAESILAGLSSINDEIAESVMRGLAAGWPAGHKVELAKSTQQNLDAAFERLSPAGRGLLVRLSVKVGNDQFAERTKEIYEGLFSRLEDETANIATRIAAGEEIVAFGVRTERDVERVLDAITPRSSPEFSTRLFYLLREGNAESIGQTVIGRFAGYSPAIRQAAVSLLLSRAEWTREMLSAIEQGTIPFGELSLDQRQSLARHPVREIRNTSVRLLREGGGLPSPDRSEVLEELAYVAGEQGNVESGKAVFTKHCAKCHRHGNEGESIGPDLTGMAVHPKEELLIQILDPSRSVEGNFRAYTLVKLDGQVLNGMLSAESATTIELFDAEGKKHSILRNDIDELLATTKSLMPDGFEKQMEPSELADLLEFLTAPGKYVPLDLAKVATVSSAKGMFNSENAAAERLIFSDWGPKEVNGVPFQLADPRDGAAANVILMHGPSGSIPPRMPRNVELTCNLPVKQVHFLSGVSGWGFPYGEKGTVSLTVRFHYSDGDTEDHPLRNGEHFADYIRRVDVPGSEFAFALRGQQIRYLALTPQREQVVERIELIKGPDGTAPVVMAVTIETPQ